MVAPSKLKKNKERVQVSVWLSPEAFRALEYLQEAYATEAEMPDNFTQAQTIMRALLRERNARAVGAKKQRT